MRLYQLLRKTLRLPRPNEIWQDKVENKWDLVTGALYFKFTSAFTLSYVGMFFGLIQTILLISVKFNFGGFWGVVIMTVLGAFMLSVIGHILLVFGILKRENTLTQSHNKEIMEILRIVKKEAVCKKCEENNKSNK